MQDLLLELILEHKHFAGITEEDDIHSVATFGDAGVMTSNKGIVLRAGDGSEFQITIVKSR